MCRTLPPGSLTAKTNTGWPSPRSHFGQPDLWRTMRCNKDPRSNSAVGRLAASLSRLRTTSLCFTVNSETLLLISVNQKMSKLQDQKQLLVHIRWKGGACTD